MKNQLIIISALLLILSSCQRGVTAYEGDLFIPQRFSTSCMEENLESVNAMASDRDFSLKANGDLIRKNPEGGSFFFKITSSISMMSDEEEGFCIMWLAYDLKAEEELTVFLYDTSIRFVYDNGEACHYRMACTSDTMDETISLLR